MFDILRSKLCHSKLSRSSLKKVLITFIMHIYIYIYIGVYEIKAIDALNEILVFLLIFVQCHDIVWLCIHIYKYICIMLNIEFLHHNMYTELSSDYFFTGTYPGYTMMMIS